MTTGNRKAAPMNLSDRTGFGSVDTYTRLAPSVERDWIEQFVLEQRLLGVPGRRIGDSLVVVESHVSESGESALAAFGEPRAYAVEDAPEQPGQSPHRIDPGWGVALVLGLLGMLLTTFSAQAAFTGESALAVTVGHLVLLAIVSGSLALLLFASHVPLRMIAQHPVRSWVGWIVLLVVMVGALLLLPQQVGEVSIGVASAIGVALLAAGFLLQLRAYLGGRVQDDPIVGPGEQPDSPRAGLVTVFLFPVATSLMIGFSWLLQQIPGMF
jgi:hypothetical protein